MDRREGYEFAVEHGYLVDRGNFYKLFKTIARIKGCFHGKKSEA